MSRQPIFFMSAGGPGAGKSYIWEHAYRPRLNAVEIDSDQIVLLLPESMDWNARHATAKKIADAFAQQVMRSGSDVFLHCSGANFERCARWLHLARDFGYKTVLVNVRCGYETACSRCEGKAIPVSREFFQRTWVRYAENIAKLMEIADETHTYENEAGASALLQPMTFATAGRAK